MKQAVASMNSAIAPSTLAPGLGSPSTFRLSPSTCNSFTSPEGYGTSTGPPTWTSEPRSNTAATIAPAPMPAIAKTVFEIRPLKCYPIPVPGPLRSIVSLRSAIVNLFRSV